MRFAPLNESIPEAPDEAIWTIYDLRDPETWNRAGREHCAWGVEYADVHRLDGDHVVIVYRPGGARRLAA